MSSTSLNLDFSQGVLSYVSWTGLGSLGLSGLLALCAKASSSQAQELDAVRQVESLADLRKLASLVPILIAVTGRVCSKLPLQCEMSKDKAVIREVTEEEYVWKTKLTGAPQRESVTLRSERSETEWFLEDNSRVTVRVEGGARAAGLVGALDVKQEYYHDKGEGARWKAIANMMLNVKKDGTAKTERYLPLGTVVTAVGQLHKVPSSLAEEAGEMVLRRPASGSPFYITKMGLKELQRDLSSYAATYKYFAWAFGVVGTALIVNKAVRRLFQSWRMHQMRRRMKQEREAAAAAAAARVAAGEDPEPERSADTCVVCLENKVESVYVPCGHLCCCFECSTRVRPCPICRNSTQVIRVYQV